MAFAVARLVISMGLLGLIGFAAYRAGIRMVIVVGEISCTRHAFMLASSAKTAPWGHARHTSPELARADRAEFPLRIVRPVLNGGNLNVVKIFLNYTVPYGVATYSAVSFRLAITRAYLS